MPPGFAGPRTALQVAVALGIVWVVWGSTYLAIALAIETMPPFLMASSRFLVAGAILYAWNASRGEPRADRRGWLAGAVTGILFLVGGNGGVVWAQQRVPSGVAALVIASVALWIALLDRTIFGQRLSKQAVIGLVIGFAGVALLVNPAIGGGIDGLGALVLLGAALSWAVGTLLSRQPWLGLPDRPLVGAAIQMLAGGAVFAIIGISTGELGRVDFAEMSWRSTGGLVYLVVFGSLVAFSAYVWLLQNARVSLVATYAYVNPVVAVLLGWSILGEAVTARTLLAGGVIVAGVALIVSARSLPSRARGRSTAEARAESVDRLRGAAAIRGK